ncbi:hypothetical protein LQV05_001148 [Cryptococcus neoformans]|nr:endo-1,3(4)-beta-glucanase [Cryptococcus neoformans var. grubii c45]OXB35128.1 endo-1,3(4)-beta-glucanase [Cryptococcus neoformans var. grubii]OXC59240.1 endo-1,3(4)-beta-glucanase [Cryptococcus neoformans var. grubii MW-RSA852]UOH84350.1 hypothetical protein LQV05_001148 [Cryptococcus neoformans]
MLKLALATAATIASIQVSATTYPLSDSFSGTSFFDGFRFPVETYDNTTNGDVFWATADNTSLLYVNDNNRVIIKVDNESDVVYLQKRYAPKLLSQKTWDIGTVWVMDAVHMPYGCSVWPAFWTQGPNWPAGGEIDISEGINLRSNNMVALHTTGGTCTISNSSSMSGSITYDNCDISQNSDSGCTVNDTNTDSYGAGFAAAGGGVFVAEWATDGIRVWFLTRDAVPDSLGVSASSIDTSTLGEPVALYSSETCDVQNLFGPQTLTIDITLCGDFAGNADLLAETCGALVGDNTCYTTYVVNNQASNLAQAYYEINYINVYSSSNSSSSNASTTSTATDGVATSATSGSGSTASASASGNGSSSGAGRVEAVLGGLLGALLFGLAMIL